MNGKYSTRLLVLQASLPYIEGNKGCSNMYTIALYDKVKW